PGYAGVPNPLYTNDDVLMLLGDAVETVGKLVNLCTNPVTASAAPAAAPAASAEDKAAAMLAAPKRAMIVPGYGMALAQAQHKVKQLADALEAKGASVDYAIHPVAGRMPGHMNVLLAEANVDYEHMLEMDVANPMFAETDLVVVIGANDVVNPAANTAEGTPIYGMPILQIDQAKNIIICNFDDKPGYAGVPNPLYTSDDVLLLLGDANDSLAKLLAHLR
ncbi:MAG: NAD(P)(+) transhydrogenase (Re/Si-specific) subunit beta, partial [Mailhella sp.]|nr:NAD(P)(+) transhydrogenase (Re/Si-specific) subunit beta [Mailhella sp.]